MNSLLVTFLFLSSRSHPDCKIIVLRRLCNPAAIQIGPQLGHNTERICGLGNGLLAIDDAVAVVVVAQAARGTVGSGDRSGDCCDG